MSSRDETKYHSRLKRMGQQLSLAENLLQTHPLVQDKLRVLQTVLHYFSLQAQWSSAGPLARLLLTFKLAFLAQETKESASGFMGPRLGEGQKMMAQLMQTTLQPSETKLTELLLALTQVMTLLVVYAATQALGDWKKIFPQSDAAAAKKAGLLLRELGMSFLFGSRLIERAFRSVGQGLGLSEKSQKSISDIGLFYLLVLVMVIEEADQPNSEDFLETLQHFMAPTLDSVEQAVHLAQNQTLVEEEKGRLALSQLQFLRRALDSPDKGALRQALASGLQALELPYEEVKKDVGLLIEHCAQLNKSFKNIFYQAEQTVTRMTQAA